VNHTKNGITISDHNGVRLDVQSVLGAIERRETRGAHNRSDYPMMDDALKVNFIVEWDADGKQVISSRTVADVPAELQAWLDDEELQIEGRLLE
jgi:succinate dehydrogenase / fumarate reductase flavoprotein subunit